MWQRLFDSWHVLDLPLPLFCGDAVVKVISVFAVIRVSVWTVSRKVAFVERWQLSRCSHYLKVQLYSKKSKKYSSFFAGKNEIFFRRGAYVPSLDLKAHRFAYRGGNNVPVDILLYYCCSLNRSSFFFLFVAFLSVLRHFFKAMLLV